MATNRPTQLGSRETAIKSLVDLLDVSLALPNEQNGEALRIIDAVQTLCRLLKHRVLAGQGQKLLRVGLPGKRPKPSTRSTGQNHRLNQHRIPHLTHMNQSLKNRRERKSDRSHVGRWQGSRES